MDAETLLSWGKDIAHFLFSTFHLLLTRILPLIVMLLGSLFLHLLRLILSFLSPMRSWKALFFKENPSDSAIARGSSSPAPFNSAADNALQEEALNRSAGDHEEVGASAVQEEELAFRYHEPSAPDLQEERFEDCFDADFIEGQRLLLKQFEDRMSAEQMMYNDPGGGSRQRRISRDEGGQGRQGLGAGDNSRLRGDNSQRDILFASDLPLTLDHVVQAAKDDAERSRLQGGGRLPSLTRRSIPPTLSTVQKALQEMRTQEISRDAAPVQPQAEVPARPPNPATRTTSYDKFFAKFTEHFKLDRD